jgi:hypothetical protein
MSLYVVKENQDLLWNVINKNQQVRQYFAQFNPENMHEWFKTIIRSFYEKYKNRNITATELNNINRETILHMIESIRSRINAPVSDTITESATKPLPSYQPTPGMSISTPPIVPDTRQDTMATQFEQIQLEYTQMNKRKEPDLVDFSEKADDGVMLNMDDLIKQQMQQREYDMNNIPPTTLPSTTVINVAQKDSPSNITIPLNEEESKPEVSVDIQTCKEDINAMRVEMESMRQEMRNQSNIINSIQTELSRFHEIHGNNETTRIVEEIVQTIETNNS